MSWVLGKAQIVARLESEPQSVEPEPFGFIRFLSSTFTETRSQRRWARVPRSASGHWPFHAVDGPSSFKMCEQEYESWILIYCSITTNQHLKSMARNADLDVAILIPQEALEGAKIRGQGPI